MGSCFCKSGRSVSTTRTTIYGKEKLMILIDEKSRGISNKLDSRGFCHMMAIERMLEILSPISICLIKLEIKLKLLGMATELLPADGMISKSRKIRSKMMMMMMRRRRRRISKRLDRISKFSDKLLEFKSADDPFAELDFDQLDSSCEELQTTTSGLVNAAQKRLSSAKRWRKVFGRLYSVVFDLMLAISVLLAVVAPTAVVAPIGGAIVMKSCERWVNSLWDQHEMALESEKETAEAISSEANEMERILKLAKKLEQDLGELGNSVDSALEGDHRESEAMGDVLLASKELEEMIMGKTGELEEGSKDLQKKVDAFHDKLMKSQQLPMQLGFIEIDSFVHSLKRARINDKRDNI